MIDAELLSGLAGTVIGIVGAAVLGYWFWRRQQRQEARMQILRETCASLVEYLRFRGSAEANAAALEACISRLEANRLLASLFFGEEIGRRLGEALVELGARPTASLPEASVRGVLASMADRLR